MSNVTEQTIFVRNLIDVVREHRCLYDKKDTAYFNRREKEKAWHIIGQRLGRSDVACHRRWKLLREKFAKELKKRDRALKHGEDFISDWTCFDNIMYIEEHIAPRKKGDKLPFVLTKNLTAKTIVHENTETADTTTKSQPYCPTGLEFLAQLSKATLQATQISESNDFSERIVPTDTKSIKDESLAADEVHKNDMEKERFVSSESECSSPTTSRPETPTAIITSSNAIDTLLKDLHTNKEISLNFVKNLTNALRVNNLDIFKEPTQSSVLNNHPTSSRVTEDGLKTYNDTAQRFFLNPDQVSAIKEDTTKDEIVRNTLLRVNGINQLVNKNPNDNLSMEVTSSASQPTIDIRDEIFGKMVVTMLGDITDEEFKDDAKFGIMQVLINSKRACKNKQLNTL